MSSYAGNPQTDSGIGGAGPNPMGEDWSQYYLPQLMGLPAPPTDPSLHLDATYYANEDQNRQAQEGLYNDAIAKLGYTGAHGEFVPGSILQAAQLREAQDQAQRQQAIIANTQLMQQQGTLFSGMRAVQQAQAEQPYVSDIATTELGLPIDMAAALQDARGSISAYNTQNDIDLAGAMDRYTTSQQQQPSTSTPAPAPAPAPTPAPGDTSGGTTTGTPGSAGSDSYSTLPYRTVGCFVAETMISTPDGEKRIDAVQQGDTVLSYDTEAKKLVESKVTRVDFHPDPHTVIEARNGHGSLIGTPYHMVWDGENWVQLGAAKRLFNAHDLSASEFSSEKGTPSPVFNLHVDHPAHNYVANGYVVHNIKMYLMARGGEVDGPTPAILGEKGPEAVVPMSGLHPEEQDMVHGLIQAARSRMANPNMIRRPPPGIHWFGPGGSGVDYPTPGPPPDYSGPAWGDLYGGGSRPVPPPRHIDVPPGQWGGQPIHLPIPIPPRHIDVPPGQWGGQPIHLPIQTPGGIWEGLQPPGIIPPGGHVSPETWMAHHPGVMSGRVGTGYVPNWARAAVNARLHPPTHVIHGFGPGGAVTWPPVQPIGLPPIGIPNPGISPQ